MSHAEKIEEQASLWVVRMERGLTAAEQDLFLEWLAADPRHGEELSAQKRGWNRLDLVADWRPAHADRPNRDLLAPEPRAVGKKMSRTWWLVPATLAAAAIALFFWWPERTAAPQPTTPGKVALVEQRTLEDGSTIDLNRGAAVAVAYTLETRRVTLLRGEARFQVAKNPARPFIVSAGGVDVRAVGTAFHVRMESDLVAVVVTEGKVQVQGPPGPGRENISVNVGEEARVRRTAGSTQVAPLPPAELARVTAWSPRMLDFTEAPLAAIVEEFNRANAPVQIVVEDPALAETVLSASLRSDNVEGFLRLLEGGLGIESRREGNRIVLRRRTRE